MEPSALSARLATEELMHKLLRVPEEEKGEEGAEYEEEHDLSRLVVPIEVRPCLRPHRAWHGAAPTFVAAGLLPKVACSVCAGVHRPDGTQAAGAARGARGLWVGWRRPDGLWRRRPGRRSGFFGGDGAAASQPRRHVGLHAAPAPARTLSGHITGAPATCLTQRLRPIWLMWCALVRSGRRTRVCWRRPSRR
eukprot:scaffold67_cov338-Prasinococcus_capsulatus_cf.AAC.7